MSYIPVINRILSAIYIFGCFTFPVLSAESNSNHQVVEKNNDSPSIMLSGGGLEFCSHASGEACSLQTKATIPGFPKTYELSQQSLTKLQASAVFTQQSETLKLQLNTVFEYFYANELSVDGVSGIRDAFNQALGEDGGSFFVNLPNDVFYGIQDFTELPSKTPYRFQFNSASSSQQLLARFMHESEKRRGNQHPLTIVLVTAGYRDALSAAQYYQTLFTQLATEITPNQPFIIEWLPLDIALAQALVLEKRGFKACHLLDKLKAEHQLYNRTAIWPELTSQQQDFCTHPGQFATMLNSAHGLFIAGGDAQRLLDSLEGLDEYIIDPITHKVMSQTLFVAGDGAGAHVLSGGVFANRPVPIITGGKTKVALIRGGFALPPVSEGCEKAQNCTNSLIEDDLTFSQGGPFNLLPFAIVDTEFSEHDRIGRLALLSAQTKTRFGIGIDQKTAVLISSNGADLSFNAMGSGGVMFLDMQDAIFKSQSGKHQLIGLSHYINNGDGASYSSDTRTLNVRPATTKQRLSNKTMVLQLKPGEFRRQVALNCGTEGFHRWSDKEIAWLINPIADTVFVYGEKDNRAHCSYTGLLFGIEN